MGFKVVVPAAGEGRRLRPHTHVTPKVLLEVAGKPIIGHIMDRLLPAAPEEVCVVVGTQGSDIEAYLTGSFDFRFRFVRQDDPKGLGDAVFRTRSLCNGEPMLVLLGDTIVDLDVVEFTSGSSVIGVKEVDDPRRFGVVEVDDTRVRRLVEKPDHPKSNLAVVGVYYFADSRPLFDALSRMIEAGQCTRGEFQLTDALQLMVEAGVVIRTKVIERWFDCGTAQALIRTNRHLLEKRAYFKPREGTVLVPPLYAHDSAVIECSVVGPNVSVGPGAQIRYSLVRDSIINREAIVESVALEQSILGERSAVRGNLRRLNLGGYSELETG